MTAQTSQAAVPTTHASRYLQQLCKHWGHKFPVDFDAQRGTITLPLGTAELTAHTETLGVLLTAAPEADMDRFRQVVAEHINRFAHREGELLFDWQ